MQLHKDSLTEIKNHKDTKIIKYEDYPLAFDYIDNRFPQVNIKEANVYCCNRKFLDSIGYKGIGGFYSFIDKIIVIPDKMYASQRVKKTPDKWSSVRAVMSIDEILVHEMCHFSSHKICNTHRDMQIEEEFAYGNSVDYSRQKGRSDEDIINGIMLPYLVSVCLHKRPVAASLRDVSDEIFNHIVNEARELGRRIIKIWDQKNNKTIVPTEYIYSVAKRPNLDLS